MKDEELDIQKEQLIYGREALRESEAMISQIYAKVQLLQSEVNCYERERQEIVRRQDTISTEKDSEIKYLHNKIAQLEEMMVNNASESEESKQSVETIGESTSDSGSCNESKSVHIIPIMHHQ